MGWLWWRPVPDPMHVMALSSIARTPSPPFLLLDDVVVLTNAAMRAGKPPKIVAALAAGLEGLLSARLELPDWLLEAGAGGHTRRELYRSREHGYEVVAITWAPGQASMVHDHGDTWGVEAVLQGRLEVLDYRVKAQHRALSELRAAGRHLLQPGAVLSLLPPHDLHQCRNVDEEDTAVSLHIYGKHLQHVKRYTRVEGDLYRPQRVMLGTA